MRSILIRLLIAFIVVSFVFFTSSPLCAKESNSGTTYVDLDGDGIDDNAADADNNSIPDQAEENHNDSAESESGSAFLAFKPIENINQIDLNSFLSNSERFARLKSAVSALTCCRGGLEAGENFGPGNGIGSGAVSGGCPGGVCH